MIDYIVMYNYIKKEEKSMKRVISVALLSATIGLSAQNSNADIAKEGVKYIKMLGGTLKAEVKKRMKDDPTGLQAAYLCSKSAQSITKDVNAKFPEGVRVYRTALKYRNEKNKPDATDIEVMKKLDAQIKMKDFKKKPVVVNLDDKYRVYIPLITQKLCLKCHGNPEKMDSKVKETISKNYPNDKATGFKEGSLRGVIVAEIKKDKK